MFNAKPDLESFFVVCAASPPRFAFMRDPANRESLQKGRRHDGIEQSDRAPNMSLYFDPDRGVMPKQAEIDMEGFNQVIQVMAEAGEVKSLLPAAENSSTSSICGLRR